MTADPMTADYAASVDAVVRQIGATPGFERLTHLRDGDGALDPDMIAAIVEEASRFSTDILMPFDKAADRAGCMFADGRVLLAPGHQQAWAAFRDGGWIGTDIPEKFGGQGLACAVAIPVQEMFDRGSISFGMAPGAARSAARLLQTYASPDIAEDWIPRLASGEASATICISESDAGSDVGRIRTRATRSDDGRWTVNGEKIWISYGDHDLSPAIAHFVLARSDFTLSGTQGLSLFLVPGSAENRNGVMVRRIEEKLGLHASPTCALGFENADAILIGAEGRGIAQLFRMIVAMRLSVGTQGLGIASACLSAAAHYALERRQGGPRDQPPVPIIDHVDVRLMLAGMNARIATLRGLVYAAAVAADLSDIEPEAAPRARAASLLGWLLPIVKNSGAETGFEIASEAVLIFGGAGYTREWPIERHLRDARILAIYEGTTGMQAIDLVRRRWLKPDKGYEVFIEQVRGDLALLPDSSASRLRDALILMENATAWLRDPSRTPFDIDAAARAGLRAATIFAHGWIAARLTMSGDAQLAGMGRHGLSVLAEQMPGAGAAMRAGTERLAAFADMTAKA